jgi:CheY-like chemotaxis protein
VTHADRSPSPKRPRIIVADDKADVVDALRLLLKGAEYTVFSANSPAGAEAILVAEEVDIALIDMNYTRDTTSGDEGLELIGRLRALDPS